MKWDKPISAGRADATPEQMQNAWRAWVSDHRIEDRTARRLATLLCLVGAISAPSRWPCARVADRMIQKARKAGVIEFRKGRWHVIQPEDRT